MWFDYQWLHEYADSIGASSKEPVIEYDEYLDDVCEKEAMEIYRERYMK